MIVDGIRQIRLRNLGTERSVLVPGSKGAYAPFWSPDGRRLAFSDGEKLKVIDLLGGESLTLCSHSSASPPTGAWSPLGYLLFADPQGIMKVPQSGGTPTVVMKIDPARGERLIGFPALLPDGKRFLAVIAYLNPEESGVFLGSLGGVEPAARTRVLQGTGPAFIAVGVDGLHRLFYRRGQNLLAHVVDPVTLEKQADAVVLTDRMVDHLGTLLATSSKNGVLAFATGRSATSKQLTWFSRAGKRLESTGAAGNYRGLELAPDGKRVALSVEEETNTRGIWTHELGRGSMMRLGLQGARNDNPVWSPEGASITFLSRDANGFSILTGIPGNAGSEKPLLVSKNSPVPLSWSPDGRYLLHSDQTAASRRSLFVFDTGAKKDVALQSSGADELEGQFSPDGRWVAYTSNESQTRQIYVRSFQTNGGKWQVSTEGGTHPRWRRDGKELFFVSLDGKLMGAPIRTTPAGLQVGVPVELFASGLANWPPNVYGYDVTADGQRFLVISSVEASKPDTITVLVNWNGGK